jgi:hypothetical protein
MVLYSITDSYYIIEINCLIAMNMYLPRTVSKVSGQYLGIYLCFSPENLRQQFQAVVFRNVI